jgi:hypothetical protein
MRLAYRTSMGFSWIAALTLWTLLIGPIMDGPRHERTSATSRATAQSGLRK